MNLKKRTSTVAKVKLSVAFALFAFLAFLALQNGAFTATAIPQVPPARTRLRPADPVSRITAVQNKSSFEVFHLTAPGLRVGFYRIRFAVGPYPIPIPSPNCSGSDSVQRQGQGAATGFSDQCSAAAIRSPSDEVASSGWFYRRNSGCGVGVSPAHRAAETAAPQRPEPEEVNAVRCPGR